MQKYLHFDIISMMKIGKYFNQSLKGGLTGGSLYIAAILLALVGFGAVLTQGITPPTTSPSGAAVTIVPPAPDTEKKNLQLYTFGYTTPAVSPTIGVTQAPTPVPTTPPVVKCPLESIKTPGCGACFPEFEYVACDEKPCLSPGRDMSGRVIFDPLYATYNCGYSEKNDPALAQKKLAQPNCRGACVAKPVIYLYPTIPLLVDVKVKVPGKIIVSDPLYPENGWTNVYANPDGILTYQNKKYTELFFESDVDKVIAPNNGIVIAKKELKEKLTDATTRLGLIGPEQHEFLDYWLPVLNDLNSPYILFSIIDSVEKERIDNVKISPTPDTFIAFIAYFKPLKEKIDIKPLNLPAMPPKRIGFTAIEWGGTIDN